MRLVIKQINIIIWYIICISIVLDSQLFIYPSLSRLLVSEFCMSISSIVTLSFCFCGKKNLILNKITLFSGILLLYIIYHGLFVCSPEKYMMVHLLCTISFSISFSIALKEKLIEYIHICDGICLIAFIQIVVLTGQFLHITNVESSTYSITGANPNPNISSMCLVASIPFLFKRLKEQNNHQLICFVVLILVLFYVLYLKCRTSYLCLLCYFVVCIVQKNKTPQRIGWIFMGIFFVVFIVGLFIVKIDSSFGRLFVWSNAREIIIEYPLGIGWGLFEKHFNDFTAMHSSNIHCDSIYQGLSYTINSAYNDYIEFAIQGGIIGLIMFIMLYICLIISSIRQKIMSNACVIIGFCSMSCVNFVHYAYQPWLIFIVTMSLISYKDVVSIANIYLNKIFIMLVLLISIYTLTERTNNIESQYYLGYYSKYKSNTDKLLQNVTKAGTSEAYLTVVGDIYFSKNEIKKAITYYDMALKYTSSPSVFLKLAMSYDKINKGNNSLRALEKIHLMVPRNILLKYILLLFYDKYGFKDKACNIANEILLTPAKKTSPQIYYFQSCAEQYLTTKMIVKDEFYMSIFK